VEDGQTEIFPDAGDRLNEGVIAEGGFVGQPFELFLQLSELVIVVADHGPVVLESQPTQGLRFGGQEGGFPGIAGGAGAFGGSAVVSQLMGVDARQEFRATPDVEETLTEQGPERPFLGRVDVSGRDEMGAEQVREFLEVVVFDVGVNALLALAIHDADVPLPGMEIDSAIVFGGGGVILHGSFQ
jgi:hypothetical protein